MHEIHLVKIVMMYGLTVSKVTESLNNLTCPNYAGLSMCGQELRPHSPL